MVGNLQIPQELTDILEIKVVRKDKVLRDFLINLANKVETLENRVKELENAG